MGMIILFMGARWQRGMSEEEPYRWPFIPREMLGAAKANRDVKAGRALRGAGAEMPATGIPADKQPPARMHSVGHQGKSGVFFHGICHLAALEVLCKHQLMKELLERVQRRATRMMRGLEHLS